MKQALKPHNTEIASKSVLNIADCLSSTDCNSYTTPLNNTPAVIYTYQPKLD